MSNALVRHPTPRAVHEVPRAYGEGSSKQHSTHCWCKINFLMKGEGRVCGEKAECRICQDMNFISKMGAPCACNGTIKFAHRSCVQRWCDEKEDVTCEICHQRYKPVYTVPLRSSEAICNAMANTSAGLVVSTNPRELHSPDFTVEDVELLLEAEFDEYNNETNNDNQEAATSKKAALIFLTILLLKDFTYLADESQESDQTSSSFYLILGVLVPCYITTFIVHYWTSCKQGYDTSQLTEPESEIVTESGEDNSASCCSY